MQAGECKSSHTNRSRRWESAIWFAALKVEYLVPVDFRAFVSGHKRSNLRANFVLDIEGRDQPMQLNSLIYEKSNGIARITKNNPPQYGMTLEVLLEMKQVLEDAARDEDIAVIVISAGGEGFHMGAVVFGEVKNADWNLTPVEFREIGQFARTLFRYIETLEKPVIGVAKAGAVGGGFENLHVCDFVIAADTAKFSQPEVKLGLCTGWGGSQRLTRMVGWRKAKELLLTGREIDGREAERIGAITKSVPLDQVDAAVDALCDELKLCAPVASGYTKLAMNKVWETDHRTGLDFEVEAWGMVNSQGEFNADVFDDFLNGRQPSFKKYKKITSDWLK